MRLVTGFPSPLSDLGGCLDLSGVRVLIFIQSAPNKAARRAANRQTWMTRQAEYDDVSQG